MNEVTTEVNGARSEDLPEFLRREAEKKEVEAKVEEVKESGAEAQVSENATPFLVDPS